MLKETEFGIESVLGIETNAKCNVSLLNSCKVHHCTTSNVVINISTRVSLLQPQYTPSPKLMFVHLQLTVVHEVETTRRSAGHTYEIPQRTMVSILSPQARARLGCILLH